MAAPSKSRIAEALLDRHGETFSEELGIPLERGTPSALFRWLCASLLFSARISGAIALDAARALSDAGWTTPGKLAGSSWGERTQTLNEAGYARYDERTATMLGDSAELLLERYRGDVRRLREEAEGEPERERELLKELKGVGDVGVDVFFREAQIPWPELRPFADRKALRSAGRLGLPEDPKRLTRLAGDDDAPRLTAALVRADLAGDHEAVLEAARAG